MHSDSDFSQDEHELLTKLEADVDAAEGGDGGGDDDGQQADARASSEQPKADTPTEQTPPEAEKKEPASDEPPKNDADTQPQGDVRAALRAARRSERRALSRAEELEAEIAELRKQATTAKPAAADSEDDDEDLKRLDEDYEAVAKPLRRTRDQVEELKREIAELKANKPKPSEPEEPEFEPQHLPPQVQDAVDEIPELLTWQTSATHQDRWKLAVKADDLLREHPKWRNANMADRLKEAVRRVKAELDEPAPPPSTNTQRRDPAKVIAETQRKEPLTLSDIRGGAAEQTTPGIGLARMAEMTDEEILNALD